MTVPTQRTVLIMAGGTGGHVFPGLAVAEELKSAGVHVEWLGTKQGIEASVVPEAGINLSTISISGLRGKGLQRLIAAPILLFRALLQAIQIIRRIKPVSVLGMGGFASGPGGLASWLLRIPLIVHEQNAIAGTTNAILSRFATVRLQAFPDALPHAIHIGNPIRRSIAAMPEPAKRFERSTGKLKLLVLGGSLGATALNTLVPAAISLLEEKWRPDVWHQVGKRHLSDARQVYQQENLVARVDDFIEDMSEAYGWADLVICRAGALTVSEITSVGIAAIFIPYPYAIDDHQTKNAEWVANNDAGFLFQQSELTKETLSTLIKKLTDNRQQLTDMAIKSRRLSIANSANHVAEQCLEVDNA